MSGGLDRPVFSYDGLRRCAGVFLQECHPTGTIPIPIEEIIELGFEIDIIPVPGLHVAFEVDGFISSDLRSITVDEFVYRQRPTRYRFTLAHEIAHAVLHQRIYTEHRFERAEEWKCFQREMDEEDRGWLEWQAYAFAGLVLVPREALAREYRKAIAVAGKAGLSLQRVGEAAQLYVANWLGRRFNVSAEVVERRLRKDGVWG